MSGLQRHPFHMVKPSVWPFFTSIFALAFVLSVVMYLRNVDLSGWWTLNCIVFLCICAGNWWREVVIEAHHEGHHTKAVQKGLRLGVILFIVSEIMFFFAFFWAFFHSSLAPAIQIGCVWPPAGITPFDPWGVPLLNTFILLLSGLTITATHHYLVEGNFLETRNFYVYTLILALLFTGFQFYEYLTSSFSISDGIYGSTFFMTTGLHGAHVIVGTIFIFVCFCRTMINHFSREHHVGFEAAAWYWHFVDVVWLFLFVSIYWWGGRLFLFNENYLEKNLLSF